MMRAGRAVWLVVAATCLALAGCTVPAGQDDAGAQGGDAAASAQEAAAAAAEDATGDATGGASDAANPEDADVEEDLAAIAEAQAERGTIAEGQLRDTVFALVSSAENSTIDYEDEYGYIEDIGDGRGYTCGIIGFTTATGDALDVARVYLALAPSDNPLAPYVSALEAAVGSDTHDGLGAGFEAAWKKAADSSAMRQAQDAVLDEQYMLPAVADARTDGLSPLGQYIYYDALVVHGPGDDEDSFGGIRAVALSRCKPPSAGGNEAAYLNAFLDARTTVMQKEEAHSDLSRIEVQRTFIKEGKYDLKRPLAWVMYGDDFRLA